MPKSSFYDNMHGYPQVIKLLSLVLCAFSKSSIKLKIGENILTFCAFAALLEISMEIASK